MITCFDVETTGLVNPEVIQAGYLSVDVNFTLINQREKLFGCSKPIEWDAMGLHGITNEKVQGRKLWSGEFLPINTTYLVAHNTVYDTKFFTPDQLANIKVICTLKLARKLIDKSLCGSHKNATLFYYLECYKDPLYAEYLGKTHTALSDCAMTLNVLYQLLKKFNLTIEEAYQLVSKDVEEAPVDINVCFFKKHQGKLWKDVVKQDKDYVMWLLNGNKIQDYLLQDYLIKLMGGK